MGLLSRHYYARRGENAKFMASQRVLPGLIPQFLVLCIITMRKLMLFYVPDHASAFFLVGGAERRRRREENVLTVFLFLVSGWSWHNDRLIFDLQETDSPGMILIKPTCWSKRAPLSCWYMRAFSPEQSLKRQACAQFRDLASFLEDVARPL